MSNIEQAAGEKEKLPKVMITLTADQSTELQKLRAAVVDAGLQNRIPSTAALAGLVFQQGMAVAKNEIKEAKAAKKNAGK